MSCSLQFPSGGASYWSGVRVVIFDLMSVGLWGGRDFWARTVTAL